MIKFYCNRMTSFCFWGKCICLRSDFSLLLGALRRGNGKCRGWCRYTWRQLEFLRLPHLPRCRKGAGREHVRTPVLLVLPAPLDGDSDPGVGPGGLPRVQSSDRSGTRCPFVRPGQHHARSAQHGVTTTASATTHWVPRSPWNAGKFYAYALIAWQANRRLWDISCPAFGRNTIVRLSSPYPLEGPQYVWGDEIWSVSFGRSCNKKLEAVDLWFFSEWLRFHGVKIPEISFSPFHE